MAKKLNSEVFNLSQFSMIKNHRNARNFPKDNEKNFQPSQTVPDQTLTILQILDRHARGLPFTGAKVPVYHGESLDLPDPRTLDLSEIDDLKEAARNQVKQYQLDLKNQAEAKRKKPASVPLPGGPLPGKGNEDETRGSADKGNQNREGGHASAPDGQR